MVSMGSAQGEGSSRTCATLHPPVPSLGVCVHVEDHVDDVLSGSEEESAVAMESCE